MKELEAYVKSCLKFVNDYCETQEEKEHIMHQAYGALSYYAFINPDKKHELDELWEKYYYKFFK